MGPMTLYALGGERPRIHPDAYVHPEAVVIGEVHKEVNADDTTNLFTPTMSRGAAKSNK